MTDSNETENTFRILVSTDNHLGFAERDSIRGPDSLRTFEEILHLAQKNDVDFIFFAGDIFHESRPSMYTLHEAVRLFRAYCMGPKPVRFELLSDPDTVFANTAFHEANYLSPNLNVAIPAFTIHGNHDDPSGPGGLCAADLLHSAGLVNLIGKTASVENIEICPLLLRKGSTHLAIYGLGAMREERVHRLFANNMVTFLRPTEQADQWFSLCAVHQNRVRHGPTSYLPEHFLPDFLDLVIWGHEHECRIEAEWNTTQKFYVIQPGSSVATSLSEGEACDKAVALLEIREKEFKVTRLPLKTVRPLIFEDIALEDEIPKASANALDLAKQVEATCVRLVESCIRRATEKSSEKSDHDSSIASETHGDGNKAESEIRFVTPAEPLVRIRLDLTGGFEAFSMLRFGQRFIGRVANPKELIAFNRNREQRAAAQAKRALKSGLEDKPDPEPSLIITDNKKVGLDVGEMENLVRHYLGGSTKTGSELNGQGNGAVSGLDVFTAPELGRGLRRFVDHDAREAIKETVESVLGRTVKHLRVRQTPEDRIVPDIHSFSHSRQTEGDSEEEEDLESEPDQADAKSHKPGAILASRANALDNESNSDPDHIDGDEEDALAMTIESDESPPPAKSTTSRRGRGSTRSRAPRATGRTRAGRNTRL
ncbi:unnamed protein product [Echinostoma caproni]|uniref:Double-strand break repair protein n=1 Tax=Echinostoma caproni TaxID=27848 RepID=A0A183AII2_9TREM|nr:unnamed protein product [Echinostoma caproni]